MSVYLDNCCYNRPFDDQTQVKIFIETLAKLSIQQQMRDGVVEYVWSEVLDFDIFDYTEWRKDNLFPNETVDSLYDKINAYSAVKGELRSAMVQETVW